MVNDGRLRRNEPLKELNLVNGRSTYIEQVAQSRLLLQKANTGINTSKPLLTEFNQTIYLVYQNAEFAGIGKCG